MSTSIGGLSTSTSNGIRGYGGLASGLDRDTLIEGMTSGTTSKINQQQQKKQQLEWKQSAVRNIASQLLDFANKYTSSWSSKTNLFSSMFWGRSNITTTGANNKYVSVSGTASSAANIKIMGVKQLAEKATWSADAGVSDATLKTGKVSFEDYHNLVGRDLKFEVAGKTYSVTLDAKDASGNAYDYTTEAGVKDAIKKQLATVKLKDADGNETGATLADKVDFDIYNDAGEKKVKFEGKGAEGEVIKLTGGTALGVLGMNSSIAADGTWNLTAMGTGHGVALGTFKESNLITKFNDRIAGQELTFSYNGSSKSVYMPSASELQKKVDELKQEHADWDDNTLKLNAIKDSLQTQLNNAFGKNRVEVNVDEGALTFKTVKTVKDEGASNTFKTVPDTSSTISLVGGGGDLISNVLQTRAGESNRVNLSAKLSDAGFKGLSGINFNEVETIKYKDEDGTEKTTTRNRATISINGTKIAVYEDDTMNALMDRINSNTDVKVSYQAETDKFVFTSKEEGASGTISLRGAVADGSDTVKVDGATEDNSENLLNALFGTGASTTTVQGTDAIIAVKYAGSNEVVELTRGSNSFDVDGLTINVKGTFNYDDKGVIIDKSDVAAIGIDAQVDADSIVDAVKSMVDEYNAIIELVNKELTTKPDRDYAPLTSEQKKELSEDEIEAWEKKAKEGLLHADSDIRSLSSDLRFIIGGGIAQELAEMGISTSSTYSDNGKLTFDESKFRAALASNPERVQQIFAESSVTNTNGNGTSTGIATALKNVMDKYVSTTGAMESKGILIRKAGHESSPMSVTENTMYKQLQEIEKLITKFQERLETERDRYIKQFTSLETLISQMNSQSGFLSQLGGY